MCPNPGMKKLRTAAMICSYAKRVIVSLTMSHPFAKQRKSFREESQLQTIMPCGIMQGMNKIVSENRLKLNMAENLSRHMQDRGLTQTQLAEKAHVSQSFVSKLLRGKSLCSSLDLKNLAEALGVRTDDLVSDPPVLA
jgi:predicted XRE-type DNA-binding protein